MDVFAEYLAELENPQQQARLRELFAWILQTFPNLKPKIAWNQPMFTDHGTYVIGFSVAKQHLAVAPEQVAIVHFQNEITQAGYAASVMLFRIKWDQPIDYALLERLIRFNIREKADCQTFWRE